MIAALCYGRRGHCCLSRSEYSDDSLSLICACSNLSIASRGGSRERGRAEAKFELCKSWRLSRRPEGLGASPSGRLVIISRFVLCCLSLPLSPSLSLSLSLSLFCSCRFKYSLTHPVEAPGRARSGRGLSRVYLQGV